MWSQEAGPWGIPLWARRGPAGEGQGEQWACAHVWGSQGQLCLVPKCPVTLGLGGGLTSVMTSELMFGAGAACGLNSGVMGTGGVSDAAQVGACWTSSIRT